MCNFKIDYSNFKIHKDYKFKLRSEKFNNGRFQTQIA